MQISPSEHSRGLADAPLVLEEYGDFECPFCKQAYPVLQTLLAGQTQFVRFIYRH
ncbi:thioredoxin domain-containing protein [Caenimonas sp. S4]|nr:thioredoxin domain-containing protein [Caenimonas soli]